MYVRMWRVCQKVDRKEKVRKWAGEHKDIKHVIATFHNFSSYR